MVESFTRVVMLVALSPVLLAGCPSDPGCESDSDCGGDACNVGTCNAASGACTFNIIADCCERDSDCVDDPCTVGTCDTTSNACSFDPIADCCESADDCANDNLCATATCEDDTCVLSPVTCQDGESCQPENGECGACAALPMEQPCFPPPAGLVGWWTFDTDASAVQDGLDGTLENGATAGETGVVDGALGLDGVDDYVEIADSPALTTSSGVTVDAWVNAAMLTADGAIVSKYDSFLLSGEEQGDERISWYFGALAGGGLRLTVCGEQALTPGSCVAADTQQPVLAAGCWHFVAGTFNTDTQEAKIYVDGAEAASSVVVDGRVGSIADTDVPVNVGTFTPNSGDKGNFWPGLIDEVEIFNRALEPEEIEGIFDAGTSGKCAPVTAR